MGLYGLMLSSATITAWLEELLIFGNIFPEWWAAL
jgi:hypothetical protein